jgi:hypothetical protein
VCKVTEVMEQMGANCLQMSTLGGIYEEFTRYSASSFGRLSDTSRKLYFVTRQIQTTRVALLEFGHFREIKVTDFHGRHDHVKRLFAAGTKGRAHGLDIREHVDEALVETEVPHSLPNLPVFYQ